MAKRIGLMGLVLFGIACTADNANQLGGADLAGPGGGHLDLATASDGDGGNSNPSPDLLGTGGTQCPATPICDAAAPNPGTATGFSGFPPLGSANHRGRDLFLKDGDPQWVIARFAFGASALEQGIAGQAVDIYLLRGCGASWETLATATTSDGSGSGAEGVDDAAGRVFYQIPQGKKLGVGRHRLHLVLKADLSTTDLFVEVVPAGTKIFVTDVDGTLTTSENAQFSSLFTGTPPDANPDAATALSKLAARGYRPLYLTARPEWLVQASRDWLLQQGFPAGILHTTTGGTGALGNAATTFKSDELDALLAKGLVESYLIGNTATDADAYDHAGVMPLANRIFFQFTDSAHGGRRIEAYSELLAEFGALPLVCQ